MKTEKQKFYEWVTENTSAIPELKYLFFSPQENDFDMCDIILLCPRGGYLAFKINAVKTTTEGMREFVETNSIDTNELRQMGYCVGYGFRAKDIKQAIKDYLRGAKPESYQKELNEYIAQKQCKKSE